MAVSLALAVVGAGSALAGVTPLQPRASSITPVTVKGNGKLSKLHGKCNTVSNHRQLFSLAIIDSTFVGSTTNPAALLTLQIQLPTVLAANAMLQSLQSLD